ncbi:hypothetical protein [Sphingomonas sp. LHG3406-1]|uniref:ImuA family protein n=1 Tax=Sphingomonas sp. LHG3406-1 TaxID=2804617 RepID=UPI00262C66C1|nr:hypothetical protein [Sphingomonas sp. LHG3406-1]
MHGNGEGDRRTRHGDGGAPGDAGGPSTTRPPAERSPSPPPPAAGRGHEAILSELFAASPRDAGWTGFVLARLAPSKPLLWVQERMAILEAGRVHAAGLGAAAPRLIHVEARDAKAALWAMEEGLRCPALGGVIGELWGDSAALDFTATRRLAVASERSGVACWLIRLQGSANLSGARERWRLASAPSADHPFDLRAPGAPRWKAELFRSRRRLPGTWLVGDEAPDLLPVAAEPGDRALGQWQRHA